MKYFLDTNALVYSLHLGAPKHKQVCNFLERCLQENTPCYFLSSSLKDAYYILCKHYLSEAHARACIKMLRESLDMVDLNSTVIDSAFESDEPDFEDALIRAAAEKLQVNAIISYDEKAFKNSFVMKMTAEEANRKGMKYEND